MAQDRKTMLQDQEALQIVLENLSCFNLNNTAGRLQLPNQLAPVGTFYNVTERNSAQSQCQLAKFDIRNPAPGTAAVPNVTEHVTVPSSEHVAEIVGRQGCKIKALRNKTNTYIKTPGRGDEPLFIITGQREDVALAVHEINQASAHFTNIRAQRNKGLSPPALEGHVTDRVQVPYRVVGLVVGPKGQTIKQIQTKTSTYIVTPSREREPIFEISGLPENVAKAREEIISYITVRTGMFLEENAVGQLTQTAMSTKTPTGIWNPSRQDIDELDSVSDVLTNSIGFGDNGTPRTASHVRPFTGRSLSLTTTVNQAAIVTRGNQGCVPSNRRPSNLGIGTDENRDPLRCYNAAADSISSLFSPGPLGDLNINTFNPFNYDSRSLLPQGSQNSSPEAERGDTARNFRFGGLSTGSGPFGMSSNLSNVSPQSSDGSQHSDPCSDFSNGRSGNTGSMSPPELSIAETVASTFGLFGTYGTESNSVADFADAIGGNTWVLSPPRPSAQVQQPLSLMPQEAKKCSICTSETINSVFIPCGHRAFCSDCTNEYVGMPCPFCSSEVKNFLRV